MDVYGPFPFGKSNRQRKRADLGPPGTGSSLSAEQYCSLFDDELAAGRTTLRPNYDYMHHDGLMRKDRVKRLAEVKQKKAAT